MTKAAEKWETQIVSADYVSESLFRDLGKDLTEEARVKAIALARSQYDQQSVGGWIEKTGRKYDRTGFCDAFGALFKPGAFDLYVVLAIAAALAHMSLLGDFVFVESGGGLTGMLSSAYYAVTVNDTAARLATMYVAGHLLWLLAVSHVLIAGEMRPHAGIYAALMVVCVVVGGPACALALSTHCVEHARSKTAGVAAGELLSIRWAERRAFYSDCMQWVYLIGFAAVVALTTAAFGAPALDPRLVGIDLGAIARFYAWPLELIEDVSLPSDLQWLAPATLICALDWLAIFGYGLALAVSAQLDEDATTGLLGVPARFDMLLRVAIILLLAFPNPYVGLAAYMLLDTRHYAPHPLLPDCTGALQGHDPPRAMATWKAREAGSGWMI